MMFRGIIGNDCENNVTESGTYGYQCYTSIFQNKLGHRNTVHKGSDAKYRRFKLQQMEFSLSEP
jgi:hypothetical protein